MKLTDFGIIFAGILISLIAICGSAITLNDSVSREQIAYNNAIDTAVDDSLFMLVEKDDGDSISVDTDKAVDVFFDSLCLNLSDVDVSFSKEIMKHYIPVIVFALNEGVVAYYHTDNGQDGEYEDAFVRGVISPYRYKTDDMTIDFFLDGKVKLILEDDLIIGDPQEVGNMYDISCLEDEEEYNHMRSRIIIDSVTDMLSTYSTGQYKEQFNKNWEFDIPLESDTIFNRTIEDISMYVMFSGMPYSNTSLGYYNKFAFGGARIWKKE